MDEQELFENLRKFTGIDRSPTTFDPSGEDYVKGGIKLWPVKPGMRLLELEAEYTVIAPAMEVATYGMTLQVDTPELGRLQARSMGWNERPTLRVVASLGAAKLPQGRHRAVYTFMAFVKVSPTVVKGFIDSGSFDFEIE